MPAINAPLNRKLRMGLVGGAGGFIGRIHAMAAQLDGRAELVAGALSSDPEKSRAAAPEFGIAADRAYGSWGEMLEKESSRNADQRLDFVTVATPNHTHHAIASSFVRAGFNVLCDKPLTIDLAQAQELAAIVQESAVVFGVTHNYTGYPLVRLAREMVKQGDLGAVQAVRVTYLQGSLRRQRTPEQQRRFAWKTDPARAGASGCFGDIGIHAFNLVRFVTGLRPEAISCCLESFDGMPLDDYGSAVLRFHGGALGTVTASRISHGRENDLSIEIDGTRAALVWRQEEPNSTQFRVNGRPHRVLTRDPEMARVADPPNPPLPRGGEKETRMPGLAMDSFRASCRLPAGHPEGFIEAFANVYTAAFEDVITRAGGNTVDASASLYPNVQDGVEGVAFVTQCLTSSRAGGGWMPFDDLSNKL